MQSYLAPTYLAPSAVIEPSVPPFPPLLVFLPFVLQVQLVCRGHLGTSKNNLHKSTNNLSNNLFQRKKII